MNSVLEGLSIIVTRPESQARVLIEKLNTLGAQTTAFPTVEIKPINDSPEFLKTIDCISDTDIIIFISRNAVKHTLPLIKQQYSSLPEHLTIIAVGPGTAEEIKALDVEVDFMPDDHYNTDGLLALKTLIESTGKHIIIARGEGGKERLAETLTKRGAHITYLESYRRALPKDDISAILKAQPDLIIATSNDVLQNLYDMTPESLREALLDCQLLVISPGMVEQCETLGFSHPAIVAMNASDESIIKALL